MYRQGVRGPGGRRIAADYRVTAYQPATLLAFKTIAGPVRATGEFRVQEAAGATTLTMSLGANLAGVKRDEAGPGSRISIGCPGSAGRGRLPSLERTAAQAIHLHAGRSCWMMHW